ncbi:MAG: universal stress protein [Planctomycetota bacterium]
MLVTESRPRNLKWFHAGPLLYGDWGTSRLYVLGLAFLYTAHASVIYLAAIGLLMLAVSWAYTIVCKAYPDGGGVYTAARRLSPTLSVVGSTLLLSGYIMTAAISVIEAFHYFGIPDGLILPLSVGCIVLLGFLNWFGARSAGRFALFVAFAALAVSGVMGLMSIPFFVRGVETISFDYFRDTPASDAWINFTKICLALAGVEAVANMTGMMKQPVGRESKRTIWPVTIEVVGLNMVFGLALAGLGFVVAGTALVDMHTPDRERLAEARSALIQQLPPEMGERVGSGRHLTLSEEDLGTLPPATVDAYESLEEHRDQVEQYTNASMKIIARESATHWLGPDAGFVFSKVAGITFGLLLLSATNTAIMAMVSVLFAMSQDRELPRVLGRLNYSGVPWVGLIVAVLIPIGVIAVEQDVTVLAKLYVLGVCGAITTTLGSTAANPELKVRLWQRTGLWLLAGFLLSVTVTIAVTQLESLAFSGGLVMLVLIVRAALLAARRAEPEPIEEPSTGWLGEVRRSPVTLDPSKPRVMLAARGRYQAEFAVDYARSRGAILFAVFVRTLRVMDVRPGMGPRIETDADAQQALGEVAVLARDAGVPFIPIYITSPEIADEILDHTVTYACDTLIMGKSKRSLFSRKLAGDVITSVAESLPSEVALITRSADDPHIRRPGR